MMKKNKIILFFFIIVIIFGSILVVSGCSKHKGCEIIDGIEYHIAESGDYVEVVRSDGFGITNAKIKSEVMGLSVEYIRYDAFYYCEKLETVEIPSSIIAIGDEFRHCSSLKKINIENKECWLKLSFAGSYEWNSVLYVNNEPISKIKEVKIPDSVIEINSCKFYKCVNLESIEIPNSVTSIGWNAFSGCSSLTSIEIPNSVTSIGDSAFSGCSSLTSIKIPNSVTRIGWNAFSGCSSLTSIEIPNSVTSIGDSAFSGCSSLTSIKIPNSVTSIGFDAFFGCRSLTSIEIPSSVTSIGDSAFSGCRSLTSIEIPNSVTSIGNSAFSGCSSLRSITLPFVGGGVKTHNEYQHVFGYIFGENSYKGGEYIVQHYDTGPRDHISYYIPSTLKEVTITGGDIFSGAFYNCSNIETINLPSNITSIGWGAFYGCKSLESISIPNSVIDIGNRAFYGCKSLESISIPNSVIDIGILAFARCSSLESIEIPNSVTIIYEGAFAWCDSVTKIYYYGTSSDWENISLGYRNDGLSPSMRYFYSESEPQEEGNYYHYDSNGNIVEW